MEKKNLNHDLGALLRPQSILSTDEGSFKHRLGHWSDGHSKNIMRLDLIQNRVDTQGVYIDDIGFQCKVHYCSFIIDKIRRILCHGAPVAKSHVVFADKCLTRAIRYVKNIAWPGQSPTINGRFPSRFEFSVLSLIFPHLDKAFCAKQLTLTEVLFYSVHRLTKGHLKIDSVLHVCDVSCIKYCTSPELMIYLFSPTLWLCDVFFQVAGVFCKFRPRACTYRLDLYSCCVAYGPAPFGPIECKQLLMYVSCVSVHTRCISLHMTGAYTLSFFEIRGRIVQPRLSQFGLSKYNVQGLYSPTRCILLYFSRAQWPKIWIKCTTCRCCVWQSALHHRGKQCPGESSTVPTLIQLHLQERKPIMRTMFPRYFRRILHLRPWGRITIFRRPRVGQRHRNREVIIAHGNGRFTIDNFFIVRELNLLLKNWAGLFCSLKFALFKWPRGIFTLLSCLSPHYTAAFHRFTQLISLKACLHA